MATRRTDQGPTPAGGVGSEIYFKDDQGNAVDEADATQAEIVEYDADGHVIARTHVAIEPKTDA